jgi:hypothetical protein
MVSERFYAHSIRTELRSKALRFLRAQFRRNVNLVLDRPLYTENCPACAICLADSQPQMNIRAPLLRQKASQANR